MGNPQVNGGESGLVGVSGRSPVSVQVPLASDAEKETRNTIGVVERFGYAVFPYRPEPGFLISQDPMLVGHGVDELMDAKRERTRVT
jgi:hypothetical protein